MKRLYPVLSLVLGVSFVLSLLVLHMVRRENGLLRDKLAAGDGARAAALAEQPAVAAAVKPVEAKAEVKEEAFTLERAYLRDWGETSYCIYFSDTTTHDEALLREMISIEPELPLQIRPQFYRYMPLEIVGDFKPGESYRITVKKGLTSEAGLMLEKDLHFTFLAPDLPSRMAFATTGVFLPVGCAVWQLPLQISNPPESFQVEVRQAHAENLIDFLADPSSRNTVELLKKKISATVKHNEKVLIPLDLAALGISQKPGLYSVALRPGGSHRVLIVTDLAVTAAKAAEDLVFAVRSLSGKAKVEGATVSLYSDKRRLLASASTDALGHGRIAIPDLADKEDSPALLVVRQGDDTTYFSLDWLDSHGDAAFPEPPAEAMAAFLYPERGVCRPGETLTLFAMLRKSETLSAQGGVPMMLVVNDPQGRVFTRLEVEGDALGCYRAEIAVPVSAPTGGWSFSLVEPGALEGGATYGQAAFQVAEFVPDSIALNMAAEVKEEMISLSGRAAYYFGTPLADARIKIMTEAFSAPFTSDRYRDFSFGMADYARLSRENASTTTDSNGHFTFTAPKPKAKSVNPLRVALTASAQSSAGGRSVSASASVTVHSAPFYIGTREAESTESGKAFDCAVLSPEGEALAELPELRVVLSSREWRFVLKENNGTHSRVWQEEARVIGTNALVLAEGRFTLPVPFSGSFAMEVIDAEGAVRHARDFWFWRGEAGERMANPNTLTFSLNAERYRPGEVAKLTFESPFAGEAIVVSGGAAMHELFARSVEPGSTVIEVPIPADAPMGSFFAGITLISRATPEAEPQRLFGLASLPVDQSIHRLGVTLRAPERALPGEQITVKVSLTDHAGAPAAGQVQLWGVDEGVLALTGFATPDPFAAFFGQRCCPWRFGDAYGLFYPVMKIDREAIGGDSKEAFMNTVGRHLSDRAEQGKESAVVLCEALSVPASGEGEITLTLPDHTGSLRLMATAAAPEQTGSGACNVMLRRPVSLRATAPRVLAPGDTFEVLLEGFNHDEESDDAFWNFTATEGLDVLTANGGKLRVPKGSNAAATIRLAVKPDAENVAFTLQFGVGGETHSESIAITVRPPMPAVDTLVIETLKPGETRTFTSGKFDRIDAGSPILSVRGALDWLNDYPHGCLEQTTAQAFPFLGVKALVQNGIVPEAFTESAADTISLTIGRLSAMRLANHTYAMWPGSSETWFEGSLFAWHFLLEAEAAGYAALDKEHREGIIRFLRSTVNNRADFALAVRAYALYILALAEPNLAEAPARITATEKAGAYSAFLIGSALIRAGQPAEGLALLKPALVLPLWEEATGETFGCLDSKARRLGLALWILDDILPDDPANTIFARELQNAIITTGHWGSTQQNAWAALGLSRWLARRGGVRSAFTIAVDGGKTESVIGCKSIEGQGSIRIENTGSGALCVFHRKRAIPKAFTPEACGFSINRTYSDLNGNRVTHCKVGDLLEATITLHVPGFQENVVITDLLPAGLEIEDETLLTRSRVFDSTGSSGFACARKERRFDRFLAFGDLYETGTITYRVRAAVRGTFAQPPVLVESMYQAALKATARENDVFTIE